MALASGRRKPGTIAEINVTPLADVMIVLLIIFMVAMPVITGAPVALPPAAHAAEGPQTVKIVVSAAGTITIDRASLDEAGLEDYLREHATSPSAELSVLVQADQAAAYAHVARVLDACRRVGVEEVSLATQPRASR